MCIWLALCWALFAVTCCIEALKTVVFALFNAFNCERTVMKRLAMLVCMDSMMVLAVLLSDTSSAAVSLAKQLFEAYPLWVAVMTPEARGC